MVPFFVLLKPELRQFLEIRFFPFKYFFFQPHILLLKNPSPVITRRRAVRKKEIPERIS